MFHHHPCGANTDFRGANLVAGSDGRGGFDHVSCMVKYCAFAKAHKPRHQSPPQAFDDGCRDSSDGRLGDFCLPKQFPRLDAVRDLKAPAALDYAPATSERHAAKHQNRSQDGINRRTVVAAGTSLLRPRHAEWAPMTSAAGDDSTRGWLITRPSTWPSHSRKPRQETRVPRRWHFPR